ncbi:MAG: HAD family hydrolase [Propioniciclava sp.]|uniref:HAD-IIB family hydrolase n=1 Tax=Propioniciclava sp. TaxID=2038686 RepID=UPI0039E6E03E
MAKTVFIDFDGTLAYHAVVPAAHLEAVRQARQAGHRVFLCTGRPKVLIPDRFRTDHFDGMICASGAYVEVDGDVLTDVRFPAELAATTASVLMEHDATFILEAPDRIYTTPAALERLRSLYDLMKATGVENLRVDPLPESLGHCSFAVAAVMASPVALTDIADLLGPEIAAVSLAVFGGGGYSGDLHLSDVDKAIGMAAIEKHLGLDRADFIGIGDDVNDLAMLNYAATSVVVEGGPEEVLATAHHIIPGPASDGLVHAFTELGLT